MQNTKPTKTIITAMVIKSAGTALANSNFPQGLNFEANNERTKNPYNINPVIKSHKKYKKVIPTWCKYFLFMHFNLT